MTPAPERPDHFALVKGTSFVCAADGEDWPCHAVTPAPERPDHALHFDPDCEECVYLARPTVVRVPERPDHEHRFMIFRDGEVERCACGVEKSEDYWAGYEDAKAAAPVTDAGLDVACPDCTHPESWHGPTDTPPQGCWAKGCKCSLGRPLSRQAEKETA